MSTFTLNVIWRFDFKNCFFFFSSRRRHTRWTGDWSSDVCSSDLTFGTEPGNPMARVNVKTDGDGALHGTIGSATDSVSSGFLLNTAENATGAPLPPQGLTRIRITFTHAGTYKYICALHDVSGMLGTVVVLP